MLGESDMKGKIGFIKTNYETTEMENQLEAVKTKVVARKSLV